MAIELTLEPSESIPRQLVLTLTRSGRYLSARMYTPSSPGQALCHSADALNEWYLDVRGRVLWHNSAAFDLTEDDVARLKKVLVPHGLDLYNDFPTAASIGPESAKVAAPAVISSSGRGEAPLPVCTDRGALEDLFEHFAARFLAAGESL